MTTEALKDLAINFYTTHDQEIEQIKTLLEIKLAQICMSYTSAYNLPKEALTVKARVKTLDSFLKKLKKKGWPVFNNPATIINDLIGARITCWFLDDCTGILRSLIESSNLETVNSSVEDYIINPKASGYRALHVLANMDFYSHLQKEAVPDKITCEIQIRTRLQDAWGDITHDLYYRAKHSSQPDKMQFGFLNDISKRLLKEDNELLKLKNVYALLYKV